MATDEELMREIGLYHEFGKDHNTYFTLVTFYGDRSLHSFYEHVNKGFKSLDKNVKARIRLHILGITFGSADAVIIWQAKDSEAEKAFMGAVLTGTGYISNTLTCSMSIGFGPIGPGPPPSL